MAGSGDSHHGQTGAVDDGKVTVCEVQLAMTVFEQLYELPPFDRLLVRDRKSVV